MNLKSRHSDRLQWFVTFFEERWNGTAAAELIRQQEGIDGMAYQLQPQHRVSRDTQWLSLLVANFETISRDDKRPSIEAVAGLKARLAQPARLLGVISNSIH